MQHARHSWFVASVVTLTFFLNVIDTTRAQTPQRKTLHGQPSYTIESPQVSLSVTETGGHMAPVIFYRDSKAPVQPYHISPWQDEPAKEMPVPVLVPLRGDFFCMPFGGNSDPLNGEKHPPHGEVAGSKWTVLAAGKKGPVSSLTLGLETQVRKGKVTKTLSVVDEQNVVYSQHLIEGFAGRVPLGHHATLAMPDQEGSVRMAASPFKFGMTYPGTFSDPKQREYQSLLPGTRWTELSKVPVLFKEQPDADLTRLPARQGYADLIQIVNDPSAAPDQPAWITATFGTQGYLWFALKNPAVLNSTVFWIENHGRHGHPWNGRNNCLGLEDVTASFADGLAASVNENILSKAGVNTTVELKADQPTAINYIQGVAKIPEGFDVVKTIEFAPGKATFISASGKQVTVPVFHEFIKSGKLTAKPAA